MYENKKRKECTSRRQLIEMLSVIDNQLVPFLTKNDQGAVAKQIEAFKQVVIHDYLVLYWAAQ